MKHGEIISLGRHRLMCGDATRSEDVYALVEGRKVDLVLTDPPYGMKCQSKSGAIGGDKPFMQLACITSKKKVIPAKKYSQLIGDNSQNTARKHYLIARAITNKLIIWGGQYFADFLPINGGWLFWDKETGESNFSDGELAWCSYGKRMRKYCHKWNGLIMKGSRTLNPIPRIHPTQKPVELHMKILEDFSQPGDIILDCFGGSGTTLIACELTGRTCLMMEISPDYCDIIKKRYETLTEGAIPFAE